MPAQIVLGTDAWNADVFQASSKAFRVAPALSAAIDNHLAFVRVAAALWRLDSQLKAILEKFYRQAVPSIRRENLPLEKIRESIAAIKTLCSKLDEVYNAGKAAGLTNRALVGTALNSIRVRSDELSDIAESAELSLDPEPLDAIFDKSIEEHHAGRSFDLASIK